MSAKKSYNRFFIILQEEDKGFGVGPDRPPTGYVKVETKNDKSKVTVYAQNLKPYETGEYLYRCYLISHQDGKDSTAYLGIMNIDESGRGESSWESAAEDAFETKVPVEKFNAAAIVADQEGNDAVIAPLAGYMSKEKFEWRSGIIKGGHITPDVETADEEVTKEEQKEAAKFEEYEKQVADAVREREVNNIEIEDEADVQPAQNIIEAEKPEEELRGKHKHKEKHEECEHHEEKEKHEECEHHEEKEEHEECEHTEVQEHHEECEHHEEHEYNKHYYEEYCMMSTRRMMGKMFEDMLMDYDEMEKHKDLKDCRLWKVDMDKCRRDGYMVQMYPCYDLIFYPMIYNPSVNYFKYIAKRGHYLFGIRYGKKKEVMEIIFAIPGKNKPADQPFGGRTGFVRWIPWGRDENGYWVMIYDPVTGIINVSGK